jgi:hypothetical protein
MNNINQKPTIYDMPPPNNQPNSTNTKYSKSNQETIMCRPTLNTPTSKKVPMCTIPTINPSNVISAIAKRIFN